MSCLPKNVNKIRSFNISMDSHQSRRYGIKHPSFYLPLPESCLSWERQWKSGRIWAILDRLMKKVSGWSNIWSTYKESIAMVSRRIHKKKLSGLSHSWLAQRKAAARQDSYSSPSRWNCGISPCLSFHKILEVAVDGNFRPMEGARKQPPAMTDESQKQQLTSQAEKGWCRTGHEG